MQGSDNSAAAYAPGDVKNSYGARTMSGIVQGLDARTGMGKIKGTDGATYRFFSAGVITAAELHVGQSVNFMESDGVASKISVALDNTADQASIGGMANSSSAPVGQARSMQGIVETFDSRSEAGKIKGEDGGTYRYFLAGVVDKRALFAGRKVEFVEVDGMATKVTAKRISIWQRLFGSWRSS